MSAMIASLGIRPSSAVNQAASWNSPDRAVSNPSKWTAARQPMPERFSGQHDRGSGLPELWFRSLPQDADATLTYMRNMLRPVRQIGHFKLVRMLGAGAFGAVWLAEDETGRKVALKLRLSGTGCRFAAAKHNGCGARTSNIVSIYEVGRDGGRVFVASQYLDGLTLQNP